jgi:hypothetical protein
LGWDVGGVDSQVFGVKKQMQRSMLSFFGIVRFGHFAGLTQPASLKANRGLSHRLILMDAVDSTRARLVETLPHNSGAPE